MTLTQLEYVLAVNKFRHFGKAARSRFVTQPTLSMQVQKLEDELGVVIFDRSKSPVLVTSEGELIIEQARVVIREQKRLIDLVQRSRDELAGDYDPVLEARRRPRVGPPALRAVVADGAESGSGTSVE